MKPAVFIDFDGVIRESDLSLGYVEHIGERTPLCLREAFLDGRLHKYEYIAQAKTVRFRPGVLEALSLLKDNDMQTFIVTNQDAVGLGFLSEDELWNVFTYMDGEIDSSGGEIMEWVACIHHPYDECICKKPKAGMLYYLSVGWDIILTRSWMIGDNITDMQAGRAASIPGLIQINLEKHPAQVIDPDVLVKNSLLEAVEYILTNRKYNGIIDMEE
jgi:D-glycero-D-manno-heptose 1,7-bisphosphate phosphatase